MTVTVEIPRLRSLIVQRLTQLFGPAQAERMADAVLFGELSGRTTHGIIRLLPGRKGPVDEEPGPDPVVHRTARVAARIEGGPGMLVASMATDLAIEIAAEHGFAVVTTVGSSSTSGSLTYYVDRLTSAELVAFVSCNTLSFATPPGGTSRILGTNPFSIGIPARTRPFITDIGTSAITFGDIVEAHASGADLPPDVAVDSSGQVTRSAEAVLDGGALLTFGGHKGLGLAMAVELMAGALAGAAAAPVGPLDVWGHVFVVFSLSLLGEPDAIRSQSEQILERLRSAPAAEGEEIRIPGHRTLAHRDAALVRGTVDVDEESFSELLALLGDDG